jgi:hypothetical protein
MRADWIDSTDFSITEEAVRKSATNILPAGTVIVASRVGLGKVCRVRHETAINQDLRGFLPKKQNSIDEQYLFHWLRSVAHRIVAAGTGATVQGVTLPFLKSLEIVLPPLEEQQQIVAMLDEAFAAIAAATANAEKNLTSACELPSATLARFDLAAGDIELRRLGDLVTRLTNGYVGPTRNIYVDEGVPYLLARHVRDDLLKFDRKTYVTANFNGIHKKSILAAGDVLLVQSGHIGHSAVVPSKHAGHNCHAMIVITPKPALLGEYLSAYFNSIQGRNATAKIRSGSTVPHLTCKEVRELLIPVPSLETQQRLIEKYSSIREHSAALKDIYERKLGELTGLKQALLHGAFSGRLGARTSQVVSPSNDNFATPEFAAAVIAFAYRRHEAQGHEKKFGHVKAQKALHLCESIAGIDLGRRPIKDAAGPNDFLHMRRAEKWAKEHQFFEFIERLGGGYEFRKLPNYQRWVTATAASLKQLESRLAKAIDPIVPMRKVEAEVFSTVHAAWNNLILDGAEITDIAIVYAARNDWHRDKLNIPEPKFHEAIKLIRSKGLHPDGSAKRVGGQESLALERS